MKLRDLRDDKNGYISVEAAIITTVVLMLIAGGILLVIRRYGLNINYSAVMEERAAEFNSGGFGDVLRVCRVLEEFTEKVGK